MIQPHSLTHAAAFLSAVMMSLPQAMAQPASGDFVYDKNQGFGYQERSGRGLPSEFDPGPHPDSEWAKLFAQVPNYRAYAKAFGRTEEVRSAGNNYDNKFRWEMGPMFYRGRLGENEVKVFVVGQEGAQDENVSNRAFTGSTGTKTQKFLNHMGITHSYLFLNTFVYTINGQLERDDTHFTWMEQGLDSPIVKYRHKLFDHMAKTNPESLRVILGVGSGGKASVATWVRSYGGECWTSNDLAKCDTGPLRKALGVKNPILVIGVPHPGSANPRLGGANALENLQNKFSSAARRVAAKAQEINWIPDHPQFVNYDYTTGEFAYKSGGYKAMMSQLNKTFRYGNAAVPHRDFAFGTNWRMGHMGTSSNRRGSSRILVFSDQGSYNPDRGLFAKSSKWEPKDQLTNGTPLNAVYGMGPLDLPFEPPKFYEPEWVTQDWVTSWLQKHNKDQSYGNNLAHRYKQYDQGPCTWEELQGAYDCYWSQVLQGQYSDGSDDYFWPDFSEYGVKQSMSFGHGPVYRGNHQTPKLVVLADQFSHDDFFSGRALTGYAGQMLQHFLSALGQEGKYFIYRTLPVDTLGLSTQKRLEIAQDPQVTAIRDLVLADLGNPMVITMGEVAQQLMPEAPHLVAPYGSSWQGQWNATLKTLKENGILEAAGQTFFTGYNIPRSDLPAHTRQWMGTTGSRAARAELKSDSLRGDYYMIAAPDWQAEHFDNAFVPSWIEEEAEQMVADYKNREPNIGRNGNAQPKIMSAEGQADLLHETNVEYTKNDKQFYLVAEQLAEDDNFEAEFFLSPQLTPEEAVKFIGAGKDAIYERAGKEYKAWLTISEFMELEAELEFK